MNSKTELYNSWFNTLHEKRKNALVVFKDPEYINVFNGVIEKYCDSAHFIFELLQNADDAQATEVEMVLTKDRFIFTHNGKARFTVSDPAKAEEDRKNNRLGHINAITAIGFSSKNQTQTGSLEDIKIGKFGVGFKAVFEYTTTPYIYDSSFCFKIEDYIVPTRLTDTSFQRDGKTVFVIPFDRKDVTAKQAYEDIEEKMASLEYPQLFLFNVNTISWCTPTQKGKIEKNQVETYDTFRDITPVLYEINNPQGGKSRILLMTRKVEVPDTDQKHTIAIGYLLDEKGHVKTDVRPNMHCFFPTQENIETCYIIHAPFALVDNRQQIKRKNDVNKSLIRSIGELAADSIVVLKDISIKTKRTLLGDNIFAIMHYNLDSIQEKKSFYYSWEPKNISFDEYYEKILDAEPVFLTRQKQYITKDFGWWGDDSMRRLLSTEQVDLLTKCNQMNYVEGEEGEVIYDFILCSLNTRNMEDMERYEIDIFSDSVLAKKLNAHFLNVQNEEWLTRLYKYIIDKRLVEKYQINTGATSEAPMRTAKIILNECGEYVAPYVDDELRVFFKTEDIANPESTINGELYERNEQFRLLIKKLGVQEPSVLDKIRIRLGWEHDKEGHNELISTIIRYSARCDDNENRELFNLIREKLSLCCKTVKRIDDGNTDVWCTAPQMISDSQMLIAYYALSGIKGLHYIDREYYKVALEVVGEKRFNDFLAGFKFPLYPQVVSENVNLSGNECKARPEKCYTSYKEVKTLAGLKNVLSNIGSTDNPKELSHYIWNALIFRLEHTSANSGNMQLFANDVSTYFYYRSRTQVWQSCTLLEWLHSYKWLYINGKLASLREGVYKEDILQELYPYNETLFAKLGIKSSPNVIERESIKQMSEETRETFSLGDVAKQQGVDSPEELAELLQLGRAAKQANEQRQAKVEQRRGEKMNDLLPKRKQSEKFSDSDFSGADILLKEDKPTQKKTKEPISLEDALAGFEEKANLQREEIEKVMSLREAAENTDRYTYGWLQALMALEVQSSGTKSASGKRSINVLFERILIDKEHTNRIILSGASRTIPCMLEDIDGIPVTFHFFNGGKQTIVFDNASVKEDALIIRGNSAMESTIKAVINNIHLIGHATIEVDKPIELIKRWSNLIDNLPFESDEESVKNRLRSDLKFIFGPPGTGKTTTLARRIINLMEENDECRILVLAPTNKACDVLTKKILELEPKNDYWLWRFVSTMDPDLEDEEVVYQRDSDIMRQDQVCVVSTMARYSFDGFDEGLLNSLDWDYIIIDEASMIPLYQILPPIFNEHSGKIWIAGDPFQIDPIVNIDLWKEENIYKMIGLQNFANPKTTPVQFDVELLMTQYRSIPVIGELYSQYMYGGKLLHDRSADSHRMLDMGIAESPLNIISFPVTKDSIFDTKRLMGSNIHIYSVLFTVEFLKYIIAKISHDITDDPVKIGVLSPYGIEIQSIQKLYNQTCVPYDNISVNFGTSHGFQGDQCDIVIAVMNPPSSGLKRCSELTYINKPNILNVAVSRAKDYLFLIIPDKEYELFPMLHELKKLGKIMVDSRCNKCYTSDEIEKIMFGKIHHIEDNTYVTTHQTTNIYSDPLAKYEVRIGEQAIDVQINDNVE